MTLQLHRPDGQGGIEAAPPPADFRTELRSPRWNAARLANPEMNPTSRVRSALLWLVLAAATFVILLAGYGSGFWS